MTFEVQQFWQFDTNTHSDGVTWWCCEVFQAAQIWLIYVFNLVMHQPSSWCNKERSGGSVVTVTTRVQIPILVQCLKHHVGVLNSVWLDSFESKWLIMLQKTSFSYQHWQTNSFMVPTTMFYCMMYDPIV